MMMFEVCLVLWFMVFIPPKEEARTTKRRGTHYDVIYSADCEVTSKLHVLLLVAYLLYTVKFSKLFFVFGVFLNEKSRHQ
jgi:hypothetical protein